MPDMNAPLRIGADCFGQRVSWSDYLAGMELAERLGYDSLWTPDHVLPASGDLGDPILEPYMSLAGVAARTSKATLGLLVSPVSLRHPTLMAKMITTLDHISGGRAVLGVGAGWAEAEFTQYGLDFGDSMGERLRWLEEALPILRGMLDGERLSAEGGHYAIREVVNAPAPVRPRLPILIGGIGQRVTPRLVAEYADAYNTFGDPEELVERDRVLIERCEAIGRDEREIERTVVLRWPIIRDGRAAAMRARTTLLERHAIDPQTMADMATTVDDLVERCEAYADLGYRHIIVGLLAPYDEETMTRFATEVRPRLEALITG